MAKNKHLKMIFCAPLVASAFITPSISLVAADTNATGSSNKPAEAPKEEISKEFDTFKEYADEKLKVGLEGAIDDLINYLENELEKNKTPQDNNHKEWIEKVYYTSALLNHFKNNKSEMVKNPYNFSLYTVTPKVLSTVRNFKVYDVKYGNQLYKGIKTGTTSDTNYVEAIKPDGKLESPKDEKNTFTKDEFKAGIDKYIQALISEFKKIIYDQKDILTLDKDISLETSKDGNSLKVTFKDEFKSKYSTIEKYFSTKIKERFVPFDLKLNEEIVKEKEKEEKQENNNASNETPAPQPLVPDKPVDDKKKLNNKEVIESLPDLAPNIFHDFASYSLNDIKNTFDNYSNEDKKKLFFFNNPINTRFAYEVDSLDITDGKLFAYVSINDKVENSQNKRRYKIEITNKPISNTISFKNQEIILFNQIETIRKIFNDFYKSISLDDTIDYLKLRNQNLIDSTSTMVDLAIKILHGVANPNFRNSQISSLKTFAEQLRSSNQNDVINKSNDEVKYNFLNALSSSTIDNNPYWYSIVKAYKSVLIDFKRFIEANINKTIKNNFDNFKYDTTVISNLYQNIEKAILKTSKIAYEKPLNLFAWYDSYLENITFIQKGFNILSSLTTDKQVPVNPENEEQTKQNKEFKEAYLLAKQINQETKVAKNSITRGLGIFALLIGILLVLISLSLLIINRKSLKSNKKLGGIYLALILGAMLLVILGLTVMLVL